MLYKDAAGTLEVAEDGGKVCGYASTFDRERDAYGDVVAKGAFAKTLESWRGIGKPIPLLYGHNTSDPKYNIGCVTEAREDERGLYVEAEFDAESEVAQDVRHLVKTGRLYQFSFAYDVREAAEVALEKCHKRRATAIPHARRAFHREGGCMLRHLRGRGGAESLGRRGVREMARGQGEGIDSAGGREARTRPTAH